MPCVIIPLLITAVIMQGWGRIPTTTRTRMPSLKIVARLRVDPTPSLKVDHTLLCRTVPEGNACGWSNMVGRGLPFLHDHTPEESSQCVSVSRDVKIVEVPLLWAHDGFRWPIPYGRAFGERRPGACEGFRSLALR